MVCEDANSRQQETPGCSLGQVNSFTYRRYRYNNDLFYDLESHNSKSVMESTMILVTIKEEKVKDPLTVDAFIVH